MSIVPLVALLLAAPANFSSDAVLLERTLRGLHPGLHRHQTAQQVDAHFAALHRELSRDGITMREAFVAISRLTAALRCGHTYPNPSNQSAAVRAAVFDPADKLPFTFRLEDRRMFVVDDSSHTLTSGAEVVAIDGTPVPKILDALLPLIRGDGANDGKRLHDLQGEAFDIYYPLLFPARNGQAGIAIRGKRAPLSVPRVAARQRGGKSVSADEQWQFTRDGDTATLRLGTFTTWTMKRDWRAFLRESFASARGARKLVIDIRGNEGGDSDVIDEVVRHLLAKPLAVTGWREVVRYRKLPEELGAHVSSWDDSFRDFGDLPDLGNGFFLRKEAAVRTIEPAPDAYAGTVELLIDEANSSATFLLASIVKEHGLATLAGRETGGNRRGTNGGRIAFLKLPASGIEVDVPLVGYFPTTPQPDRGVVPDVTR